MAAKPRTLPPVTCPRCHGTRTRVRYVRPAGFAVIIRHRKCLKCQARFRTHQVLKPEQVVGMDPAA